MIKKDLIDKMVNENAVVEIINFYQFWDFFKELKNFSFSKNNITKKDFSILYSKDNVVYLSLDTVDGKVSKKSLSFSKPSDSDDDYKPYGDLFDDIKKN